MWDLLVSIPDHCLSFYFTVFGAVHFLMRIIFVTSVKIREDSLNITHAITVNR